MATDFFIYITINSFSLAIILYRLIAAPQLPEKENIALLLFNPVNDTSCVIRVILFSVILVPS